MGREVVFVNMKILYFFLNDNCFVVGKRIKFWYILSGIELYCNIVVFVVYDKWILNSGNYLFFFLNFLEFYLLMIYIG